MKTQIILTTLLVISMFGMGCAKKKDSQVDAPAQAAAPPDVNGSRAPDPGLAYTAGASVSFVPESMAVLGTYASTHPLNVPSKYQINVNLSDLGSGLYAGTIQISYYDNGNYYNGFFETGTSTVNVKNNTYNGQPEYQFNKWFDYAGKPAFHAFAQDQYGAVVLVLDDSVAAGDGGVPSLVSGSIWFKNFAPTYAPMSPTKCWFVSVGPYNCQTFLDTNGIINTAQDLYPSNGYTKLGHFVGLDSRKAFNVQ